MGWTAKDECHCFLQQAIPIWDDLNGNGSKPGEKNSFGLFISFPFYLFLLIVVFLSSVLGLFLTITRYYKCLEWLKGRRLCKRMRKVI